MMTIVRVGKYGANIDYDDREVEEDLGQRFFDRTVNTYFNRRSFVAAYLVNNQGKLVDSYIKETS